MNEGCNGGWAIFHGFFAQGGNLVSEKCAPYKGSTAQTKCSDTKECPAVARVKNSYYVGGYNNRPTPEMI